MAWMLGVLAAALVGTTPTLTVVHRQPFVVRGSGFEAHERVVVHSTARTFAVRTTSLGRFVVTVGDRCTGGRILAVGAHGEQAVLRLPPTMCPPP